MHRSFSRGAAIRRLTEIEAEMTRIASVFPELRRLPAIPARLRLTAGSRHGSERQAAEDAPVSRSTGVAKVLFASVRDE